MAASEDVADLAGLFYVVRDSSRANVSPDRSRGPRALHWVDLEHFDRAESKFDLGTA